MATYKALNRTKSTSLANVLRRADNFFLRLKGLLFTNTLPEGHGLYITPCQAIHMMGMTYAIDCIFIDDKSIVVGVCEAVQPFAISPFFASACGCLELPVGTIASSKTEVGDRIEFEN